jgi:membrane protein YqaA with SNARE-associated domain
MKLFGPLYERALAWSRHPRAPLFLTTLSLFEAVFFPVAPEVMLAPMCLSQPRRGFWFAFLSLCGSLVGAVIGYALGRYAFELLRPVLDSMGWLEHIDKQVAWLRGIAEQSPWKAFWVLVLAGFSPIPLKFFTWASGIVGVPLLPFMASMAVGRGKRVFLVAGAIRIGGERAEATLRRYIEPIGWVALALIAGAIGYLVWRSRA